MGRQSLKSWCNLPICNPKTDLHNVNALTKFCETPLTFTPYHLEMKIWTCGGQVTLPKIEKISSLAIPNQVSKISTHIPSLVIIHWCLLKLSYGKEIRMDGHMTDTWTDTRTSKLKPQYPTTNMYWVCNTSWLQRKVRSIPYFLLQ